jgi:hypothetical protein
MKITVSFSGNTITKTVASGTTVGTILADRNLQAVLGFGANVQGQVDGVKVGNEAALNEGDELEIVTKANEKAA